MHQTCIYHPPVIILSAILSPFTVQQKTIHLVTTMLAASENVLFPGYDHLLTTGTDDSTFSLSPERQRAIVKVIMNGHEYWWLSSGYDLDIGHL